MPVFIGNNRNKNGEIVKVNELTFHLHSGNLSVANQENKNGIDGYFNKKFAKCDNQRVVAVSRLIFDNQYSFMNGDGCPSRLMEDCVFS
jgi:hypothetical protein